MAIRLLALTGCRRGEIEALRKREIDQAGHCLRLGDTKGGDSVRPLGTAALRLLRQAAARSNGTVHVLPGIRGKGHYTGLPKAWRRIVSDVRLPAGLSPHGLRHGFSSIGDDLGFTEATIGALIGHSSHTVTGGYIHRVDSVLIAAADKISRAIWRAMAGEETGKVVKLRA